MAAAVARRTGLADDDVETVPTLVRWHLLLAEVATTRDPEDPATAAQVNAALGGRRQVLDLLTVLTECDARAASAPAWTTWRAGLVDRLVTRVAALADETGDPAGRDADGPKPPSEWSGPDAGLPPGGADVDVRVEESSEGSVVTVVARDRTGLLAAVAGVFATQRVAVRAARVWTRHGHGFSRWQVESTGLDARVLRERLEAVLAGRLDLARRLGHLAATEEAPSVAVRPEASVTASVLEVRVANRPGALYLVCRALAGIGVAVRSAHVSTLGPQAVDVLYLQEDSAGALVDHRAAEAAHAVRHALTAPDTTLGARP